MPAILDALKNNGIYPGLVMVKPHAYDLVLDPVVQDVLSGGDTANRLSRDDRLVGMLGGISLATPSIRDLSTSPRGSDLIHLFYGDKLTRRYFPMILESYLGKVAFLPYVHTIPPDDHADLYRAIKGSTATYDDQESSVDEAAGIRGLLGTPYLYVSNEAGANLDDQSYKAAFSPVVNNYIHVCDSESEIDTALSIIYSEAELADMATAAISTVRVPAM